MNWARINPMIGVFDSGIGGLTVLRHLLRAHPGLSVVYCADTDWMPYGDKPLPVVAERVQSVLSWLRDVSQTQLHRPLSTIVVACNTAASALDLAQLGFANTSTELHAHLLESLLEPIAPGCRWLAETIPSGSRVGLLATLGTVNSNQYGRLLDSYGASFTLHSVACPGLATLIEQGQWHTAELHKMLAGFLSPLVAAPLDALVLGCTHYPLVQHAIESQLAVQLPHVTVNIIDPTVNLPALLPDTLLPDLSMTDPHSPIRFYVTGAAGAFSDRLAQLDIASFLATTRPIEVIAVRHIP